MEESSLFFHDLLNSQTPAERAVLKAIGRDGAVVVVQQEAHAPRRGGYFQLSKSRA